MSNRISDLNDTQKAVLFDRAVGDGVIRQSDVNQFFAGIESERANLAGRLNRLALAAAGDAAVRTGSAAKAPPTKRRNRKKSAKAAVRTASVKTAKTAAPAKPISRAKKASRKLQGQYLALVRQFQPEARKDWGEYAKEHGREKAVAEMRSALSK